jgi:nucleoid DNA-binding protein
MNKAKPATKTAMYQELAERSDLSKKQVAAVFDSLSDFVRQQLSKGPGVVNVAGLLKIKKVIKPATKERMGRNPQTGEPMTIKAKPKRTVVKALALKALKEMVK